MLQHLNMTKPRVNQRWLQGALCISVPITQSKDLQSPQALDWDPGDCSGHGVGYGLISSVSILIICYSTEHDEGKKDEMLSTALKLFLLLVL